MLTITKKDLHFRPGRFLRENELGDEEFSLSLVECFAALTKTTYPRGSNLPTTVFNSVIQKYMYKLRVILIRKLKKSYNVKKAQ